MQRILSYMRKAIEDYTFNHKVNVEKGILQSECEKIIKDFFKELRKTKR